ncbi:hypothetical protein JMN32_13820 [Fulvivirga sp. 29W222]|uniref:Uncharacterized protein n=1 Tax=Fulvivirga marina TaxID=2494733 RepID=A0A937KCD2_9BACT|nr:hypothetical protein [Fulvivirga marina]MBL6447392.1 hypothetical protein [Fulvivirga marina]
MLSSTEVRWFFEGALPKAMSDWFNFFEPFFQAPRTDYYLSNTDQARMGIKLREGQIQIKCLTAEMGEEYYANATGKVARYEKWNFPVVSNEEWGTLVARPEVWLPVKKERKMLRFTLGGGFPDRVDKDEIVENGCEVELSEIEIIDKTFWSLAFEAFGSLADMNLQKTTHDIFEKKVCPIFLDKENSFGYARLIHDIQS